MSGGLGRDPVEKRGFGAWWALLLLPVLCCGLPLLIAAGGAAFLLHGYGGPLLGALALAAGVILFVRARRVATCRRMCEVPTMRPEQRSADLGRCVGSKR